MQKKTVLLIGGAGAIGSYTSMELEQLGYAVDVITLEERESTAAVRYLRLQANLTALTEFLTGRHYTAIVDFLHHHPDSYPAMLALLAAHTEQLVFLSSYRVYADNAHPIREDAPQLADLFSAEELLATKQDYPWAKSMCERIILASEHAHKVTIVRPVIAFYHARLSYITLKAPNIVLRSGKKPLLVPEAAKNVIAGFSFSKNVGKEIAHLIGKEAAMGEAFTLSGGELLTWGEIAPAFTEALGSEFVWVDTDTFLAYTTPGDIGEYYGLHHDRLISRDMDITKVLAATGLTRAELTPTLEAIAQEASIIRQDPARYTIGYRQDIEDNQDRYFKK
ncbi:MAG: NAD-dependent epimerase/dehydratase family protein [Clostridia bacterium]|nr:NAD-dependent epimerase/dehydratase family protein [Clostridia bacterium]